MSLMRIGGPFHGQRHYILNPELGSVVACIPDNSAGRKHIWRKYKPEPGAPVEYDYETFVYYRCVLLPIFDEPALVFQGITDEDAIKLAITEGLHS